RSSTLSCDGWPSANCTTCPGCPRTHRSSTPWYRYCRGLPRSSPTSHDRPVAFTYSEVGATRDAALPDGYRHVRRHERLGVGESTLRRAATALANWDMQRGAGLSIRSSGPAGPGVRVASGIGVGPLRVWAPCEVVWFRDEPDRYAYGYGTLPGHPECGEEAFDVRLDADGQVWFDIRAFSRPAAWYARLGVPVVNRLQDLVTDRYVAALRRLAAGRRIR